MPGEYREEERFLFLHPQVSQPRPLLLESYTGHEAISELFSFQLELLCEIPGYKFNAILGNGVSFGVTRAGRRGKATYSWDRDRFLRVAQTRASFSLPRHRFTRGLETDSQTAEPDLPTQNSHRDFAGGPGGIWRRIPNAGFVPSTRVLRAVSGIRLRFHFPPDGRGRHLLLLQARGEQPQTGPCGYLLDAHRNTRRFND